MPPLSGSRLRDFLDSQADSTDLRAALHWIQNEFGPLPPSSPERVLRAMAALRTGSLPDEVAKYIDWKDFEGFVAAFIGAAGFEVRQNLVLTRPRVQVDILARSGSVCLLVDCKHWARPMGPSGLAQAVSAQTRRALVVRGKMSDLEPLVVVILLLNDEPTRFIEGAAVVPIHALRDFLLNLQAYAGKLEVY